MIDRLAQEEINQLLDEFPAVGVLGPRQVGKTTLADFAGTGCPYLCRNQQSRRSAS